MDKVEFTEVYGVSVYELRLKVAAQFYVRAAELGAAECLKVADEFVEALLRENKLPY